MEPNGPEQADNNFVASRGSKNSRIRMPVPLQKEANSE